jgi:hypothetical protein
MGMTNDELHEVLARAQEIESAVRDGAEHNAEVSAVIAAAEEVGLSRQSVERALAERLYLPGAPPVVGALTWARSANGNSYVAEVLSTSDDDTRVRFLRGGEDHLPIYELRPIGLTPGEHVVCDWPGWGPWTCTVVGYDPAARRVELSDRWGSKNTFPVSEVWLAPRKPGSASRRRLYATLLATGAAAGTLVGSILTALLM